MYEGNEEGTPVPGRPPRAQQCPTMLLCTGAPVFDRQQRSLLALTLGSCISVVGKGGRGAWSPAGRRLGVSAGDVQRQQMRQSSLSPVAGDETGRDPWEGLPACVAIQIFGLLPVPQRLRYREVCTVWKSLLAAPRAWIHVDLSSAATGLSVKDGSVTAAKFFALLTAASRAACGQAETLDVSGAFPRLTGPVRTALKRILRDNAASLRTVRITGFNRVDWLDDRHESAFCVGLSQASNRGSARIDAADLMLTRVYSFLAAAPNLSVLEVPAHCATAAELQAVMGTSNDAEIRARFAPVRVSVLSVYVGGSDIAALGNAFLASAPANPWLRRVRLECRPDRGVSPGLLSPIIQGVGAMAGRLEVLDIYGVQFVPEWLPVLSRTLLTGALRELHYQGSYASRRRHVLPAMPAGVVAHFCDALRESRVERLTLMEVLDEWDDAASFDSVLCALAGHRTLRVLDIRYNGFQAQLAASAQLASSLAGLLAANSPALVSLDISEICIGSDGLASVLRALASNTHLCELKCRQLYNGLRDPGVNEAFAREFVIPAVRLCGSLRTLVWDDVQCGCRNAAAPEVRAILKERRAAAE